MIFLMQHVVLRHCICKFWQAYCHEDSETDVPDGNEINVMGVPVSTPQKRLDSVSFWHQCHADGFPLIKAALEQSFANTVLRTVLPSA